MKNFVPSIVTALLVVGCANATRTHMSAEETFHRFSCSHTMDRETAFAKTEVAMAESFNDYTRVLKLRQPETGTFLIKGLVPFNVAGVRKYADYTLKTTVLDAEVVMDFTLESMPQTGIYAPEGQIPKIKSEFEFLAARVARSLGSQLNP
jgi:hypothetical protein